MSTPAWIAGLSSCVLFLLAAETRNPVLAWSAKIGPELQLIAGVAISPAGETIVVGRPLPGDIPGTPSFRNSSIFVGKLSANGTALICGSTIPDTAEFLFPSVMALAPDGDVYVAGTTQGGTFPVTPNTLAVRPEETPSAFLIRASPCGEVRFATYLPKDPLTPSALIVAGSGEVYVAAKDRTNSSRSHLLRLDPEGRRVLGRIEWDGVAGAISFDAAGSLVVAGMRDTRAVVTKFTADLQRIEYDITVGDEILAMHTAMVSAPDGSVWLAGAASPPGSSDVNRGFENGNSVPFFVNLAATLTHLDAKGSVLLHTIIEMPTLSPNSSARRPIRMGLGADGRIWVAIWGSTGFPQTLPDYYRVPVAGVFLRSFDSNGRAASDGTLLPVLAPGYGEGLPAAAFGGGGRVAVVSVNRLLPETSGSARSSSPGAASVVGFAIGLDTAPVVTADREVLDIDTISWTGGEFVPPKAVSVTTDGASDIAFTAALVPAVSAYGPPALRQLAFMTPDTEGVLPASIRVSPGPSASDDGVLVILAPGTQGLPAIPVRRRRLYATWRVLSTTPWPWEVPAPAEGSFRSAVRVEAVVTENPAVPLPVPFSISTDAAWLSFDSSSGTTPAEIPLTVNLDGLSTGSYFARVLINQGSNTQTFSFPLTIGPVLRFDGLAGEIRVPFGQTVVHKITVRSSGAPLDFTGTPFQDWTKVSPSSGRTPQEITITSTPPPQPSGGAISAPIAVRTGDSQSTIAPRYFITFPQIRPIADSLGWPNLAPGSIFTYRAGTSRCEPAAPQPTPWPRTLGGCTLRLDGQALPIGEIREVPVEIGVRSYEPIYEITAQVPYDVIRGVVGLELENREGTWTTLLATVNDVDPRFAGVDGSGLGLAFSRRPGESLLIRMTGSGEMAGAAPWGDVPGDSVVPKAPIAVFVGGRPARVLSAELSRSAVGVLEIKAEVPAIAPDSHMISVRVGNVDMYVAPLLVVSPPIPE